MPCLEVQDRRLRIDSRSKALQGKSGVMPVKAEAANRQISKEVDRMHKLINTHKTHMSTCLSSKPRTLRIGIQVANALNIGHQSFAARFVEGKGGKDLRRDAMQVFIDKARIGIVLDKAAAIHVRAGNVPFHGKPTCIMNVVARGCEFRDDALLPLARRNKRLRYKIISTLTMVDRDGPETPTRTRE